MFGRKSVDPVNGIQKISSELPSSSIVKKDDKEKYQRKKTKVVKRLNEKLGRKTTGHLERKLTELSGKRGKVKLGREQSLKRASSRLEMISRKAFYDSDSFQVFMAFITVFALIGEDIWVLSVTGESDFILYNILFVIMILFFLEMLVLGCFKPKYLPSLARKRIGLFFIYDLLGTLSMLFDIPWILSPIMVAFGVVEESGSEAERLQLAKAGKAARLGTKAGKFVKIFRLIRIIRLVKVLRILRFFKTFGRKDEPEDEIAAIGMESDVEPSQIGLQLAELVSRKVVFIVLFVMVVYPQLQFDIFDLSKDAGIQILEIVYNTSAFNNTMHQYLDKDSILLVVNGTEYFNKTSSFPFLRTRELIYAASTSYNSWAYFDNRGASIEQSLLNLALTLFTCIALVSSSFIFNNDAKTLIVKPIERMTKVVKRVCETLSVLREDVEEIAETKESYEVQFMESCITKMAGLLKVGFGEAGAQIIFENLKLRNDKFNAVVPGRKVDAIFGFCDIRQFTDTTEILQEKVMLFVNSVANIVHIHCRGTGGAPNKNVGDAFLLVWKKKKKTMIEKEEHSRYRRRSLMNINEKDIFDGQLYSSWSGIAKGAVHCVLSIKYEMDLLNEASYNAKLTGEAGQHNKKHLVDELSHISACRKMLPGYSLRLGFGLHFGWAIEGAIGSRTKIDATYLSPHVAASEDLESLTKKVGVSFLMSGHFVKLLPAEMRDEYRFVGKVLLESIDKISLIASIDTSDLVSKIIGEKLRGQMFDRVDKKHLENEKVIEYKKLYKEGVTCYATGRWEMAEDRFNKCQQITKEDGPVNFMLKDLRSKEGPPDDWKKNNSSLDIKLKEPERDIEPEIVPFEGSKKSSEET